MEATPYQHAPDHLEQCLHHIPAIGFLPVFLLERGAEGYAIGNLRKLKGQTWPSIVAAKEGARMELLQRYQHVCAERCRDWEPISR